MATYNVKVIVHYEYEVECDNEDDAIKQGWNYEDYAHHAEVFSIDADEVEQYEEPEEEQESN
jgi:hypothetical protein